MCRGHSFPWGLLWRRVLPCVKEVTLSEALFLCLADSALFLGAQQMCCVTLHSPQSSHVFLARSAVRHHSGTQSEKAERKALLRSGDSCDQEGS